MTSRDPLLTDMTHAPGWYAMLPPPAPANHLKGEQNADWVVVGASVTGLGAARRLAELDPEARVPNHVGGQYGGKAALHCRSLPG